jgi:SpoIID/LytB domain protein
MNANCPKELLKAHAVISRSWALNRMNYIPSSQKPYISDNETITWYDNEAHKYFDVCADDHCQRYQGITRAINPNVKAAIEETFGEVLVYGNEVCDARFSKCCGGASELFENCWQNTHYDYLEKVDDFDENFTDDLTVEENAVKFIMSSPKAYCNTSNKQLLSKILNSYDNEYSDFYRWKVFYTFDELSAIIKEKSGDDYGKIIDLIPLTRGVSGRIVRLKIVGEKKTRIIGKELEIRRLLSKSHLYSSAFTVEKSENGFTLYGAGWGHGVGLCQIGAAVMAENGKNYKEILAHYYKGAYIEKLYD